MTTRQPLQPLSPPTANILNTRYAHLARITKSANGIVTMEERIHEQEDMQDAVSVVSGLSSLENDAEDDFEKLMIQNARDERRLKQALNGRVQAFRKARTHPRVGLTIDNLERNNAAAGANAHAKFEGAPSSSGSTRSDPAIQVPAAWGRKSRSNRNWMRTITHEEQQQTTPVPTDDTINGHFEDDDANAPRRSVEDSPLSHKGTPRNARAEEWDLTFELNEASMIASTPYIPRNTALDDIRQREMESLREQAVATASLDRIRERSPEQTRRRTSSTRTADHVAKITSTNDQPTQGSASPQKMSHTRTKSWQAIGKSQPVTGIGKEDSPVALYKSAENIATVEREVFVSTQIDRPKRVSNRREDSQDLLRRLARVSHTPSPGRVAASRPQTAPPQTMLIDTEPVQTEGKDESVEEAPAPEPEVQPEHEEPKETPQTAERPSEPAPVPKTAEAEHVDTTPMPVERSILNPKTPVVTGAWVDTPGPRTARKPVSTERSPSRSPKKSSPRKSRSLVKAPTPTVEEAVEHVPAEAVRPQLPSSALHALVQEAKTHGRRQSADYGDSTINSLEELITPLPESLRVEMEEDTLQGLQLPTGVPRNEAERQRQQELLHLHRMNDRLRAARTSIRDASRGMKRVEDQVEHVDEGESGAKVKVVHRDCPYATDGHEQTFSLWRWWKSFFWQQRLKTFRQTSNSRWKIWGGLTTLGIFLSFFFMWWISEEIACEIYCHPLYARSSPYPFSVNMNAPRYPFVIPTLIYRAFIKEWWSPIYSFFSWIGATMWSCVFGFGDQTAHTAGHFIREGATSTVTSTGSWRVSSDAAKVVEEAVWDVRIGDDEVLQKRRAWV
ncbi:hypothetical protein EJ02DRAFT_6574 [Clathrospora elynae]|uniref:Uncharacterized protein n=1 Tax=Clathrospora elynae TaxID=706981 RepID=A0A6A5T4D7_9PLEO|nr:hypothetical protein EJ02DRAFT_6574 [Clathrospora elynae]